MDIREIRAEELRLENFAFMEMAFDGVSEWKGQTMSFDGFVFGTCFRGEFRFRLNYREFAIAAGEFFVCLPDQLFTVLGSAHDVGLKLLLVSPDFFCSLPVSLGFDWLERLAVSPCLKLDPRKLEEMVALCDVLEHYGTQDDTSVRIRNALMLALLLIVAASIGGAADCGAGLSMSHRERLTQRFFELMLQHHLLERTIPFYANRLCVTAKTLSAAVKSTTGRTAQEWMTEALLVDAKRLLKTTDLAVSEISERLHFSTPSSFVRFFRQHTGLTPLVYRTGRRR